MAMRARWSSLIRSLLREVAARDGGQQLKFEFNIELVSISMQLITLYLSTVTVAVPFPEGMGRGGYIYCLVREHQDGNVRK